MLSTSDTVPCIAVTFLRLVQLDRLRDSRDWDWMSTCASFGQPYRSRWASFGHVVVGDMTALLRLLEPRSACNSTASPLQAWVGDK